MFGNFEIFSLASGLARHASARQEVVARNIAHANTPGYRERDVESFTAAVARGQEAGQLRRSRAGHSHGLDRVGTARIQVVEGGAVGPNGNSVSVETEIMKSAVARQQHDMALAVYKSALGMLRTSLGRR